MGLLKGFLGTGRTLDAALGDYPPLAWPHPREGKHLSAAERAENLAWFLSVKDDRIALVLAALARLGVALPPPDRADEASGSSMKLHDLARGTLAKARGFGDLCGPGWRDRAVAGRDARRLAFACDIGIYCGEAAVEARGFEWTVDDTRYRKGQAMTTQGNVVIAKTVEFEGKPKRNFIDVIAFAVYTIHDEDRIRQGRGLPWKNGFFFLDDLTSGRHG